MNQLRRDLIDGCLALDKCRGMQDYRKDALVLPLGSILGKRCQDRATVQVALAQADFEGLPGDTVYQLRAQLTAITRAIAIAKQHWDEHCARLQESQRLHSEQSTVTFAPRTRPVTVRGVSIE